MKPLSPRVSLLLRSAAAAILLIALAFTVRIETAQVQSLLAERYLSDPAAINARQNARRHLQRAVDIDPADPALALKRAELLLADALLSGSDEAGEQAISQLRDATRRAPARAATWAALFQAKSSLGQFDPEWLETLQQASTLGPWDPEIQLKIIRVGADHWLRLTPAWRDIIIASGVRALLTRSEWKAREIRVILRESRLDRLVCASLSAGGHDAPRFCPAQDS